MGKGRPRQFYRQEVPKGVVKVVRAQCADYNRKKIAIKSGTLTEEIKRCYEATNEAINDALNDIEEACRGEFLIDIAENRGYYRSQINWMLSEGAYYRRKAKAVYDIAHKLCLI